MRLALDVSAWDAIKTDFIAELTDPALRQEVVFHFSQLANLGALNQEFLEFNFGTNASMSGSDATRAGIGQNRKTMCSELSVQAEALVTASKAGQQSLLKYTQAP